MSNLLPGRAQKEVWRGYLSRFIFAGSLLMLAASLLAILALVPSYYVLYTTRPMKDGSTMTAEENKNDTADIAKAQAAVSLLLPVVSATSSLSQAISAALSVRPKGIRIDNITYNAGEPASVMITGTANNREAINAYREAMKADKRFAAVAVPVGDLLGGEGGRFTFTLTGKF